YVVDVALNKSTAIAGSFEVETDTVHTSWTDANGVQYGRKPNIGAWSVETVDSGVGTYNSRTSIGVDNSAQAVVSYSVDDASSTFMRYRKRTAVNTWSAAATINSAANATMAGIGSFNDIGIATTSTVYSAFFGYDSSTPGLVGGVNSTVGTGIQISATAATDFKDMSMSIGTSNSQYAVASRLVSSNYLLVIQNTGAGAGGTVTLPTNCTDATYVSTFAKNSDSVIGMATACVMNDGSCKAYYGEATYTGSGPNFTYSAWTLIGTIKASACTLASLTAADRPTLVYDRQNSYKRSVAWRDQDNNQIKRWTDESGSNANETVLTGVGTIGYPMIAYDKVGKSYVSYKDGDAVKFVTNNARTFGAYTGGWSSPVAVVSGTTLIGIGGIGISGMKGRGNTTSGQ
ncbi:MAG: hypothetical protein NTV34_13815, partial [Proteobacteria bacterium]|nr:hypothetical protein [Pseudomonadota bacterium]